MTPRKGRPFYFYADAELFSAVQEKGKKLGWTLAVVLRKLMTAWINDEIELGEKNDKVKKRNPAPVKRAWYE